MAKTKMGEMFERALELERLIPQTGDRVARYRLVAELEDITATEAGQDHWNGPRTDDPPEGWQG